MIFAEPPTVIILAAFALGVTLTACAETGDQGRYKLFNDIAETARELTLTDTCNELGFITTPAKPNCIEKNGLRYLNNGSSIAFFQLDADSIPRPVWRTSLNPYLRPLSVSLTELRTIHSAFVEK
jgi:hypothetical protein